MVKKASITAIFIAFISFGLLTFGRSLLNSYLEAFSIVPTKTALVIASWWVSLIPALLLMKWDKTKFSELGFFKEKFFIQVLLGVVSGFFLSVVIIGVFCVFGVLDFMMGSGNKSFTSLIINILIDIVTVGFIEEFIFRGYIFKKLLDYKNARLFAVLISSVLFGLFHFINLLYSDITITLIQVGMTTLIGLVFCVFREKIKYFSFLSLIILHGVYDAALPFFTAIFSG